MADTIEATMYQRTRLTQTTFPGHIERKLCVFAEASFTLPG